MSVMDNIRERQKARKEAEKDIVAYMQANPDASRAEVTAAMKAKWRKKYAGNMDWMALLMQLLPLLLKLLGL